MARSPVRLGAELGGDVEVLRPETDRRRIELRVPVEQLGEDDRPEREPVGERRRSGGIDVRRAASARLSGVAVGRHDLHALDADRSRCVPLCLPRAPRAASRSRRQRSRGRSRCRSRARASASAPSSAIAMQAPPAVAGEPGRQRVQGGGPLLRREVRRAASATGSIVLVHGSAIRSDAAVDAEAFPGRSLTSAGARLQPQLRLLADGRPAEGDRRRWPRGSRPASSS